MDESRRVVPDEGSLDAKLVLVGEAPGKWEDARRRPFVGPSGAKLGDWWGHVGLTRSQFYITNVWPERPFNNKIETVNREQLALAVEHLHDRLAALDDPILIVPTGNIALRALMARPLFGKDAPKITDWRGSILEYVDRNQRRIKFIPTIHPAAILREPGLERVCQQDWRRIARDSTFRELRIPERHHHIEPSTDDIVDFYEYARANPDLPLAFDIETTRMRGPQVLCVGFSLDPLKSFVIPTTPEYWEGRIELSWVWDYIKALLALPNPKVTQNGHYDYYWLGVLHNIKPVRWLWDTMAMHHCLDATDQHSLDYMASTLTRQPFWKRENKDEETVAKYISASHALWTYNGIDCCVTLELQIKLLRKLERLGKLAFYIQHYRKLMRPALAIMRHGILTDDRRRRWWHFNLQADRIEIQDHLTALNNGVPLHAKKALSTQKVLKFLYDKETGLGLPPKTDRKTKKPTSGEVAVRETILWLTKQKADRWGTAKDALAYILQERRLQKLGDFLSPKLIDADDKLRATFKPTTVTGRFASARNPFGGGTNLQNQDREVRGTFIPDRPDQIFLEVDMSQIEGRIVYVRSGDPKLIHLAKLHPTEFDQHTANAQLIFGTLSTDKGERLLQRYLGKKTSHGAQRGLGGNKLAGEILKEMEGRVIRSGDECAHYIRLYLDGHPGIEHGYFPLVRKTLLRDRKLVNVWGREWLVTHERMCDDLYRQGYSWWAQSDAADLMNQCGVLPSMKLLSTTSIDANINAQVHDSLLFSVTPDDCYDLAVFLGEHLTHELDYGHTKLSVPVEYKLGRSWKGNLEFKRLPDRKTFTAAAQAVLRAEPLDNFLAA